MARLGITFRTLTPEGYKTLDRVELTGAKMTKTWIRKNYGNIAENHINDEMYYVNKPNKYGIVWVVKSAASCAWDISTSTTHAPNRKAEKTPSYSISVCKY